VTESGQGGGFPAIARDTAELPYGVTFRGLDLAEIVVAYGSGLIFCLVFAGIGAARGGLRPSDLPFPLTCLLLAAGCAYRLWLLRTPWLVLHPDRLENRELTGWRTVRRMDIVGLRDAGSDRQGKWFEVVTSEPGARSVRIPERFRTDPIVDRWFHGARDLTAQAVAADKAAVLEDDRYGATAEERAARLRLAKIVSVVFSVAGVAAGAWLYFNPRPYLMAWGVAVGAPVLAAAMVWASRGLLGWWSRENARPSILLGAIAPAVGISFKAFTALNLYDPTPVRWVAGAVAVVAVGAVFVRLRSLSDPRALLGIGMLVALCTYGLVELTDVALDQSKPQVFLTVVRAKFLSSGRSRSPMLFISSRRDGRGSRQSVTQALYDEVSVGSIICVFGRPGALRLKWIDLARCPTNMRVPNERTSPDYPPGALWLEIEGKVTVECDVINEATLSACRVLKEDPPGYGFGPAALRRLSSPDSGLAPARLAGRKTLRTAVGFHLQGSSPSVTQ